MWDAFESRSHRVQDALDVEDEGDELMVCITVGWRFNFLK